MLELFILEILSAHVALENELVLGAGTDILSIPKTWVIMKRNRMC